MIPQCYKISEHSHKYFNRTVFSHTILQWTTHKNPLKNRHNTSIRKLVAKLENSVEMKESTSVGTMTLLRPLQSARKPHRCELAMMPMDVIPERTPLCCVVSRKSHSATGNTKLIPGKFSFLLRTFHCTFYDGKLTKSFERCGCYDDPRKEYEDIIKFSKA